MGWILRSRQPQETAHRGRHRGPAVRGPPGSRRELEPRRHDRLWRGAGRRLGAGLGRGRRARRADCTCGRLARSRLRLARRLAGRLHSVHGHEPGGRSRGHLRRRQRPQSYAHRARRVCPLFADRSPCVRTPRAARGGIVLVDRRPCDCPIATHPAWPRHWRPGVVGSALCLLAHRLAHLRARRVRGLDERLHWLDAHGRLEPIRSHLWRLERSTSPPTRVSWR